MNIVKAEVNWRIEFGNSPDLIVHIDCPLPEPRYDRPIWTKTEDDYVYNIDENGFVDYICMNLGIPNREGRRGFGGRMMFRTLTDGRVVASCDCWSGNTRGLPFEAMQVVIRDSNGVNRDGAITLELAHKLVKSIPGPKVYITKCRLGFWNPSINEHEVIKYIPE